MVGYLPNMVRKDDLKIRVNDSVKYNIRNLISGTSLTINGLGNYLLAVGLLAYMKDPEMIRGFIPPGTIQLVEDEVKRLRLKVIHKKKIGVDVPKVAETETPPVNEAKVINQEEPKEVQTKI